MNITVFFSHRNLKKCFRYVSTRPRATAGNEAKDPPDAAAMKALFPYNRSN
jgi:hypothetical protein